MTACQPGKALPMPAHGFDKETKALMGLPKSRCLPTPARRRWRRGKSMTSRGHVSGGGDRIARL